MPGRKPKPVELKLLDGNPGKKRINRSRPKPRSGIPSCPSWLSPEAKKEWRRVVKEMGPTGALRIVDGSMLATYCHLWGEFVDAARNGKTLSGNFIAQMRALASEFGMTPSSRSRITVGDKQEEVDPLEELRSRGNRPA